MSFGSIHIDEETLERYVMGVANEAQVQDVEEHILGCRSCAIAAEQLNEFVSALRGSSELLSCEALVNRDDRQPRKTAELCMVAATPYDRPLYRRFSPRYLAVAASIAIAFGLGISVGARWQNVPPLASSAEPSMALLRVPPPQPIVVFWPTPKVKPPASKVVHARRKKNPIPQFKDKHLELARRFTPPSPIPVPEDPVLDPPNTFIVAEAITQPIPTETPEVPTFVPRRSWVVRFVAALFRNVVSETRSD